MVDAAIARLRGLRENPVWREMPPDVRAFFKTPPPRDPRPLDAIWSDLEANLLPYSMGNVHPRFWMWYMGAGNLGGALAEFVAAVDGSNLGGGNHAAARLDDQVVSWLLAMTGFPQGASGTLVDGGSMANTIGLTIARNSMAGIDLREHGVAAMPQPLRFYCSDQVHSAHQRAVEFLGLGNRALRRVATDADLRMDVGALAAAIEEDRAAGWKPAAVIGTAGTTNSGAVDDLAAIGALCREEGLWFHVDGCIGALLVLSPRWRHLVDGMSDADSLALDLHKGLHAPFEAGCALVRDRDLHRGTFALHPEYLQELPRGIAGAEYLSDYSLQLTRSFRALKLWMMFQEHGTAKFGRIVEQNIEQAHHLASQVDSQPDLVLMSNVTLDIVCFRFDPGGLDETTLAELNTEIMLRLQEAGTAAVSDTRIRGRHCLRAAICNHRTRREDLDVLVAGVRRTGHDILEKARVPATPSGSGPPTLE